MIKIFCIGNLGKDAEVNIHGTESVINFSLAHTEKYKDSNGAIVNKTTWLNCAYWVDNTKIAQYLKKGDKIFIEGLPEARMWKGSNGEMQCNLNVKVFSIQLIGGKREDNQNGQPAATSQSTTSTQSGYVPYTDPNQDAVDDLPF